MENICLRFLYRLSDKGNKVCEEKTKGIYFPIQTETNKVNKQ